MKSIRKSVLSVLLGIAGVFFVACGPSHANGSDDGGGPDACPDAAVADP